MGADPATSMMPKPLGQRLRVLAMASVIGAATVSACSSGSQAVALEVANQICASFHPPGGTSSGLKNFGDSPTTAGKVTALARRFLGHGLSPWDELPSDHLVVQCLYTDATTPPSNSPTTICPGGYSVVLTPARSMNFYVDQEYRWSNDPIVAAMDVGPSC
jgi:hypothetical protein